ncbi:hypothetical protein Y032_0002g869 [Ancylostoma ceylanicum]|uniref:Uncharacterized protein n=1 Tax=Ancylostoma ceylanicum TaxID=53326 RepID=A0A016W3N7_9BILA|nr:hypothetical protein Y032_0002g869 [Ancylostoma ceylanicum]
MSTGVNEYAEHEYDNCFAPSIDLSILSIFRYFYSRFGEDTYPGVIQYAEHEHENHLVPSIESSILLVFRYFCPRVGEDISTGVLRYAEHEYGKYFAPNYRFIDFFTLGTQTSENIPIRVLRCAELECVGLLVH